MHELFQYRAWALAEGYFSKMLPIVMGGHLAQLVSKKSIADFNQHLINLASRPEAEGHPPVDARVGQMVKVEYNAEAGLLMARVDNQNIALIPIVGPLTKYGELCSLGMQDYQGFLNKANAAPSIDGIVLVMDTPGGTVDGTPELGNAVKTSDKPVGVFGDGMVASAGMWIASQAAVIVGNKNNPTEFGSIGVLMVDENWQNVMDAGYAPQMNIIRAPQSTEKALLNPIETTTEEVLSLAKVELRGIASDFISAVKAGRGDKLDTKAEGLFAGRMFDVHKAKKNGLIDAVGTLQTAINKVAELAKAKKKGAASAQSNNGINSNANNMFKSKLFSTLFGKSEKAEEGKPAAAMSAEATSVQAADEKVATLEAENSALQEKVNAAEARATKAEANVTELTAQVSTLTSEKVTLATTVAEQKAIIDKKPTGTLTTTTGKSGQEESQANDTVNAGAESIRTEADLKADEYIKQTSPKIKK